jgi:pyruvate dehydrogenase phosphatase
LSPPRKSLASFLPVSSSSEPPAPSASRFIVLATDGLYDRLNNDEIVSLVGAHLNGVRGEQTRQAVLSHVATSSTAVDPPAHTHAPRQEPQRGEGHVFTFDAPRAQRARRCEARASVGAAEYPEPVEQAVSG